jgi:hypothetical protein
MTASFVRLRASSVQQISFPPAGAKPQLGIRVKAAEIMRSFSELDRRRVWSLAFILVLCIVLASCGGSSSSSGGSSAPPTATLTASPSTVTAGSTTNITLAFTSTNATSGSISGQGAVGTGGSISIAAPSSTTQYVYTATGPGGSTTATATVTVNAGTPLTVSLTASPNAVLPGVPITLTWTASSNATSVVITASSGNSPGGVQPITGGSVSFVPPSSAANTTVTYTATAYGANGQTPATATAPVQVNSVVSFDGMNYSQVAGGTGQTDIDPNGAVGTKQYMEYVNTAYQAYDKVTQQPVWPAPQPIGTPWVGSTQPNASKCTGPYIQLDAVILFDKLASRWVIAAKTTLEEHFYFCIAVSSGDDLTSATWFAYAFSLDAALGTNSSGDVYLPDWPKLGTWPDAYYATMDLNDPDNGDAESGIVACALDRTNILINGSANPMQCFSDQNAARMSNGVYIAHSLIPADADGTTTPPTGRDEYMVSIENPNDSATSSIIFNLWDFHVDWATPANSYFNQANVSVPAYTPGCYNYQSGNPSVTNCVEEPETSTGPQLIDSVGDRMMPRFSYRNFGSYESFLISQTVETGLGKGLDSWQTGILWYELRATSTTAAPAVYQQGMIGPADNLFRFLPSIAQDKNGNAAVGYSVSNTFTDPGINLSYWNLTSATQPTEASLFVGNAEEVTTAAPYLGKWGSYSSMTVDPIDDCTFWYVNEYWYAIDNVPADNEWSTQISNFQIPGCQ